MKGEFALRLARIVAPRIALHEMEFAETGNLLRNPQNIRCNARWLLHPTPLGTGCTIVEGSDSSVTFEKDGKRAYFHRSHPQRDALVYRVKAAREYLLKLEITP